MLRDISCFPGCVPYLISQARLIGVVMKCFALLILVETKICIGCVDLLSASLVSDDPSEWSESLRR